MDALLNNPLFQSNGFLLASILWALAVGWFCWQIMAIVTYPRERLGDTHPFELQRRQELRAGNTIYRWFEPLVEEVAALVARQKKKSLDKVKLNLAASREKLPWRPEEFLATKWVEGVLSGGVVFFLFWMAGWGQAAVFLGLVVAIVYGVFAPKSVGDRAKKRLGRIRSRLPFAVDLIALTMEAGGGFQECLQTAVVENGKDHPLTEELAEVLRQISLGRPRHEALQALQDRLQDEDIKEMVFAINKGEELGTPLSAILREQAEQMRLKRSQRGEKAAAEAQVNIVFPGMIVMIACLLVVIAPIVLPTVLALF
jgi:tight adherence protein C